MTDYIPPASTPTAPTPLSSSDENALALVAHLSVLVNLFTAVLGPLVPFIIYLVYKDRSRYLSYQALQAFVFQLLWWLGGSAVIAGAWIVTVFLIPLFGIGLLCLPIACIASLLPVGVIVYGIVAGIQCSQGQDFKYWLIGDWVRGTLNA